MYMLMFQTFIHHSIVNIDAEDARDYDDLMQPAAKPSWRRKARRKLNGRRAVLLYYEPALNGIVMYRLQLVRETGPPLHRAATFRVIRNVIWTTSILAAETEENARRPSRPEL